MKRKGWRAELYRLTLTMAFLALLLPATAALAVEGDATRGEQLFTGSQAMAKGGAPCIACHAVTGLGSAGSANFGPDLSDLYTDYEAEGVMAVLESLAFPSMEAIYASRPLTEQERLDLTDFFAQIAENQAPAEKSLLGLILLGIIIVFALVGVSGLRRFKGARRPLVEQARKQRGVIQ